MYSFYGGKQGRTYHLVHHYDSIKQMVDAFQQGGSYNEVNYGEYVIIDTIINKHEPRNFENGIIYRRGLNYQEYFNSSFVINLGTEEQPNTEIINVNSNNSLSKEDLNSENKKIFYDESTDIDGNRILTFNETRYNRAISAFAQHPGGGAQYVGKIVGPKGEAPQLSIVKWNDFLALYGAEENTDLHKGSLQVKDQDLRPGAEFDNNGEVINDTIVDAIQYGYLDIIDAYGNITGSYISIDFPYSVFKYHAESISPYPDYRDPNNSESGGYNDHPGRADHTSGSWEYTNLITEDQVSQEHPFFWQYDIKVPKGIRGQDLQSSGIYINRNLETGDTVGTENWLDPTTGQPILDENGNAVTDINYRYYNEYRNYENFAQGEVTRKYLDSWQRTIHKIVPNGKLNKYNSVDRSGNTTYKVGDTATELGLKNNLYLYAIEVKGNAKPKTTNTFNLGSMSVGSSFQDGQNNNNYVKWEVRQEIDASPSELTINYTHGDPDLIKIRTVDRFEYEQQTGRLYIKYSDLDTLTYLGEYKNIYQIRYIKTTRDDAGNTNVGFNPNNIDKPVNRICIIFNTFEYNANGVLVKNLNKYTLDSNGNLKFPTTTGEGRQVLFIDEQFKFINNISVRNKDKIDQVTEYIVEYNNNQIESLGELNELVCLQQYGDNIIAFYNNPQKRQQMYQASIDYALPRSYFTDIDFENHYGYEIPTDNNLSDDGQGRYYWINLGSIYKSNHIYGKFSSLSELQTEFPHGFDKNTDGTINPSMKDFAGWLATVVTTSSDSETITTYAYDYRNGQGWYKLEDLNIKNINPTLFMIISQPDTNDSAKPPQDQDTKLNNDGYWFIISERTD